MRPGEDAAGCCFPGKPLDSDIAEQVDAAQRCTEPLAAEDSLTRLDVSSLPCSLHDATRREPTVRALRRTCKRRQGVCKVGSRAGGNQLSSGSRRLREPMPDWQRGRVNLATRARQQESISAPSRSIMGIGDSRGEIRKAGCGRRARSSPAATSGSANPARRRRKHGRRTPLRCIFWTRSYYPKFYLQSSV